MTAPPPPLPDGFTAEDDQRGGYWINRVGSYIGHVFPASPARPNGEWYARRYGKFAKRCRSQAEAVAHVTQHLVKENR